MLWLDRRLPPPPQKFGADWQRLYCRAMDESERIDALWEWADPAGSEKRFREHGSAEAMTQAARAAGLQRRFDEAHALLDAVEAEGVTGKLLARVYLERGRILNDTGDTEQAMQFFKKALEQAAGAEYYAVDAAHMIAILSPGPETHEWALGLALASDDERARGWEASLLNNYGWTLFEAGDYEGALDRMQRALAAREKSGDRIHVAKWCVARCLRALGRYEDALEMQYELLATPDDGFVFEEIGELHLALGNVESSRPYFAEAAALLPPDNDTARRMELGRMSRFGEILPDGVVLKRQFPVNDDIAEYALLGVEGLKLWLGTPHMVSPGFDDVPVFQKGMTFDLWIDDDPEDIVRCEVLETDKRSVSLKWGDDGVLRLQYVEGAATLTHTGITGIAEYAAAWHSALDLLWHRLRGGSVATFEENYEALLPEYRRRIAALRPETQ